MPGDVKHPTRGKCVTCRGLKELVVFISNPLILAPTAGAASSGTAVQCIAVAPSLLVLEAAARLVTRIDHVFIGHHLSMLCMVRKLSILMEHVF